MIKPMVKIHNTETNEVIDREMTDEEYAEFLIVQVRIDAEIAEQEQKKAQAITAKEAAEAKLVALGLTTDDLKALGL
jgi:hypothetical protein